jgi:NodT family efflux transporter outer membrane factor (OMF) lipoprotein
MKPQAAGLLLLPTLACAVGPNYTKPQIPVPKAWNEAVPMAASAESLARWWTEFQDPTLDRLVNEAVAGNLDLKIAAARIREARAARGIAASAGLPQVAVNGAYARTHNPPFGPREQNVFEAGFDASWEIDVFGGVKRDKEAALADVQAAEEGRREVLVTLLADVGRSYMELRGTQQRLRILEETVTAERDTLDIARARFEAGLGAELDVARAEGVLRANEAERPVLEREARAAVYRLGVLVGKEPSALAKELETPAAIPPVPPEIPMTLPSELLSRRPDLKRAERELAAATARIGVARADLFPRFSILGSFGRRSQDIGDVKNGGAQFWNVIPAVRWPIFSGGRIRANIEVQNARQERALLQYEKQILTALEEVETALSAHTRERSREASLRAAVDSTRRALALATDRYTSGLENFLSVLDAERSVYAAEDQLVRSEKTTAVTLIAVYKALGGGWSSEAYCRVTSQLPPGPSASGGEVPAMRLPEIVPLRKNVGPPVI